MKIFSNFINIERFNNHFDKLDKFKHKSISVFNDYIPTDEELKLSKINILMIMEPNEFFGLHNYTLFNFHKFDLILTWSESIISSCPNAVLFPIGEAWVDFKYADSFSYEDRKFGVTFLCGVKNIIEGHQLRQRIFKKESSINIPKDWWYVLDDFNKKTNERPGYFPINGSFVSENNIDVAGEGKKQVWNTKKMFHICVENSKHNNYFTDRLIDCFLTKTIPIYWGCPNVDEFFDTRGIITFSNENDLIDIINNLTEEDYYSRTEYMEFNKEAAKSYALFFYRIEQFLDLLININKL